MSDFSKMTVTELREEAGRMDRSLANLRKQKRDMEAEGDKFMSRAIRGTVVEGAELTSSFVSGRFMSDRVIPKTPVPISVVPTVLGYGLKVTGLARRFTVVDGIASFGTQTGKAEIAVRAYKRRLAKVGP